MKPLFSPFYFHRLYYCLIPLLLLVARPARATHIVGGQLQMTHRSGSTYEFGLTLYFDKINGSSGARDDDATLAIYARGTNVLMDTINLPLLSETPVTYVDPGCTNSVLETSELIYRSNFTLNATRYNSTRGYYLVWERCCRNNVITNILNPGGTGQAFYLEFPALRRNSQPFINSSPQGFRPIADFACVGTPFSAAFGGTDPDGDSLVYDLVTPLWGNIDTINNTVRPRPPRPAPYLRVRWAPGYDSARQIPGRVPLRIDRRTGRLSFTPNRTGLFVFGVRCREYRNGVLLGEMRREFQQLVVSGCNNSPTQLNVKVPGPAGGSIPYVDGTIFTLPNRPGARCLRLYASDNDTTEFLRLRLVALQQLPANLSPTLSLNGGTVNTPTRNDTLLAELCFPECFGRDGRPYRFLLIAEDQACPVPHRDTVRLTVQAPTIPDARPSIVLTPTARPIELSQGDALSATIVGTASNATARVTIQATNLLTPPLAGLPISLPAAAGTGSATTRLQWPTTCSTPAGTYSIRLRVTSEICSSILSRDTTILVRIVPSDTLNTRPTFTLTPAATLIERRRGDVIAVDIAGTAPNTTTRVAIQATNLLTAPLAGQPISLPAASAIGNAITRLQWTTTCATPAGDYPIRLRVSSEVCGTTLLRDTTLLVRILPADTTAVIPPNVFTPNNDGLNDDFQPAAGIAPPCGEEFRQLRVFNRWGRLIFSSADRMKGWDGKKESPGVYYYIIEYTNRSYKGFVTLVK